MAYNPIQALQASYPVCSTFSIGDFGGGDCLLTLSSTALTISLPGNHNLATWEYSTISNYGFSSTSFYFMSSQRGPYGEQKYVFNLTPLVKCSLQSVITARVDANRDEIDKNLGEFQTETSSDLKLHTRLSSCSSNEGHTPYHRISLPNYISEHTKSQVHHPALPAVMNRSQQNEVTITASPSHPPPLPPRSPRSQLSPRSPLPSQSPLPPHSSNSPLPPEPPPSPFPSTPTGIPHPSMGISLPHHSSIPSLPHSTPSLPCTPLPPHPYILSNAPLPPCSSIPSLSHLPLVQCHSIPCPPSSSSKSSTSSQVENFQNVSVPTAPPLCASKQMPCTAVCNFSTQKPEIPSVCRNSDTDECTKQLSSDDDMPSYDYVQLNYSNKCTRELELTIELVPTDPSQSSSPHGQVKPCSKKSHPPTHAAPNRAHLNRVRPAPFSITNSGELPHSSTPALGSNVLAHVGHEGRFDAEMATSLDTSILTPLILNTTTLSEDLDDECDEYVVSDWEYKQDKIMECGQPKCTSVKVSYPACSISSFGDFNGGDCLITLSSTALTISLPDNYPLATWHYRTIRAFSCTSTIFSFTSGRRGPFGAHEYEFNVNPQEMSSLLSVLSATTGMKIARDVTTGNHTTQFEYGSITENISVSSNCCYDVANSTFHIDKPSGMKIERDVTSWVSYPACSIFSIGDFGGGDCLLTLSSTALTISLPDNQHLVTWDYSTISNYGFSSTSFYFMSSQRGPYGGQKYVFKLTPLVKCSLQSVITARVDANRDEIDKNLGECQTGTSCNILDLNMDTELSSCSSNEGHHHFPLPSEHAKSPVHYVQPTKPAGMNQTQQNDVIFTASPSHPPPLPPRCPLTPHSPLPPRSPFRSHSPLPPHSSNSSLPPELPPSPCPSTPTGIPHPSMGLSLPRRSSVPSLPPRTPLPPLPPHSPLPSPPPRSPLSSLPPHCPILINAPLPPSSSRPHHTHLPLVKHHSLPCPPSSLPKSSTSDQAENCIQKIQVPTATSLPAPKQLPCTTVCNLSSQKSGIPSVCRNSDTDENTKQLSSDADDTPSYDYVRLNYSNTCTKQLELTDTYLELVPTDPSQSSSPHGQVKPCSKKSHPPTHAAPNRARLNRVRSAPTNSAELACSSTVGLGSNGLSHVGHEGRLMAKMATSLDRPTAILSPLHLNSMTLHEDSDDDSDDYMYVLPDWEYQPIKTRGCGQQKNSNVDDDELGIVIHVNTPSRVSS